MFSSPRSHAANILGRRAGRIAFGIVLLLGMGSLACEVIRGHSLWGTFGGPFSAEADREARRRDVTRRDLGRGSCRVRDRSRGGLGERARAARRCPVASRTSVVPAVGIALRCR